MNKLGFIYDILPFGGVIIILSVILWFKYGNKIKDVLFRMMNVQRFDEEDF